MSIDRRVFPTTGRLPTYTVVTSQPEDWAENYDKYYIRSGSSPNYTYSLNNNSTWDNSKTYCKLDDSYDQGTSLITEYNIASLINQLLDVDGFVIEYDSDNGILDFNIMGYYFQIKSDYLKSGSLDLSRLVDSNDFKYLGLVYSLNKLTAVIKIKQASNGQMSFNNLLERGAEWDNVGETAHLVLLENNKVPLDSRIHFANNIDNGDLGSSTNTF